MRADKLILGVLGGVAVGALMGVLFAPEKGSKTRKKILDKSSDYADDLKYKFDGLLETVNEKYENIVQEGGNLITEGKAKFNNTKIK